MGFTPSLLKTRMRERCSSLVHVASGAASFTLLLCRRVAFLHRIARSESDGTRWRTGGEVKGKYANGVGSQQSYTVSEDGLSSITTADAHASAASSRLN